MDGVELDPEGTGALARLLSGGDVVAREPALGHLAEDVAITGAVRQAPLENHERDVHPSVRPHLVRQARHRAREVRLVLWRPLELMRRRDQFLSDVAHRRAVGASGKARGPFTDQAEQAPVLLRTTAYPRIHPVTHW